MAQKVYIKDIHGYMPNIIDLIADASGSIYTETAMGVSRVAFFRNGFLYLAKWLEDDTCLTFVCVDSYPERIGANDFVNDFAAVFPDETVKFRTEQTINGHDQIEIDFYFYKED